MVLASPILSPIALAIVVLPEQVPPPIRIKCAFLLSDSVENLPEFG